MAKYKGKPIKGIWMGGGFEMHVKEFPNEIQYNTSFAIRDHIQTALTAFSILPTGTLILHIFITIEDDDQTTHTHEITGTPEELSSITE
jgi:hypothetical protein